MGAGHTVQAARPHESIGVDVTSIPDRNVLVLDGPHVITGAGAVLDTPDHGPDQILNRISTRFGSDGLVLLTPRDHTWEKIKDGAGGWHITGSKAWYTAEQDLRRIRIGHLQLVGDDQDPMIGHDLVGTAVRHQLFHSLVGVPFYGDGGTTSALLMEATISVRGKGVLRKWNDKDAPVVRESPWCGPWSPENRDGDVAVDRNAQYLGAAGNAVLPLDELEHRVASPTGSVGYFRIRVPANPVPELPHPCGHDVAPGRFRWFASPTIELLAECGADVQIEDAWTCPRSRARRLLAGTGKWYERLRDTRAVLIDSQDPDSLAVLQAVKDTYSRGIGATLTRPTGRWYRPDWTQIIQAQARADMFRALLRVWEADQIWPVSSMTDVATYDTLPPSLRLSNGMGGWKVR